MTNPIRQIREGYIATRDLVVAVNANGGGEHYRNDDAAKSFVESVKASTPRAIGKAAYCLTHDAGSTQLFRFLSRYLVANLPSEA